MEFPKRGGALGDIWNSSNPKGEEKEALHELRIRERSFSIDLSQKIDLRKVIEGGSDLSKLRLTLNYGDLSGYMIIRYGLITEVKLGDLEGTKAVEYIGELIGENLQDLLSPDILRQERMRRKFKHREVKQQSEEVNLVRNPQPRRILLDDQSGDGGSKKLGERGVKGIILLIVNLIAGIISKLRTGTRAK